MIPLREHCELWIVRSVQAIQAIFWYCLLNFIKMVVILLFFKVDAVFPAFEAFCGFWSNRMGNTISSFEGQHAIQGWKLMRRHSRN